MHAEHQDINGLNSTAVARARHAGGIFQASRLDTEAELTFLSEMAGKVRSTDQNPSTSCLYTTAHSLHAHRRFPKLLTHGDKGGFLDGVICCATVFATEIVFILGLT